MEKPGSADARAYGVWGYPTFVVTNAAGEVIDRWVGYDGAKPEEWLSSLGGALADPTTVPEKTARFAAHPDAAGARALGRIALGGGAYRDAVGYIRQAQRLEPARAGELASQLFEATAMGAYRGKGFTFADARAAADPVIQAAQPNTDDVVQVAGMLRRLAKTRSDRRQLAPYLDAALRASDGTDDPSLKRIHASLAVDRALMVEHDKAKALELKRAAQPEKWQEDAGRINGFAWWCFENRINLEEAEALARQGVELATTDDDKAELLDTAASICAERGNLREAVRLEKQALGLKPDSMGYRKQLARFRHEAARS